MKQIFLLIMATISINALAKGEVKVSELDNFKLHTYYSNDVMGDASYIVEGKDGLVVMEAPLFKDGAAEFDAYTATLNKPVVARIADYHIGATGDNDIIVARGMKHEIEHGGYAAMIAGFKQNFGDAMVLPTGRKIEQDFDEDFELAGVTFHFSHGATTDFPAASVTIGGKVYLTHWAPAKAHMNGLQLPNVAAIDAEIAQAKQALAAGCDLYAGCHGGLATPADMQFKLEYLTTLKQLRASSATPEAFVAAVTAAYPSLPGADALPALATNLYK